MMSDLTCSYSCQRYCKGMWSHTLMVVMHTEILQNFCPPEFEFILCVHFIHPLLHHCHHLRHCHHHDHCHCRHHPHLLTNIIIIIMTTTITTTIIVVIIIFIGIIMTVVIVTISHSSRLPSRICFFAIWVILKCFNHSVFLMYIEYWCYFIGTVY
jgi:hypothetical protein